VFTENGETDGGGQSRRFGETRFGIPAGARGFAPLGLDVENKRARTPLRIACRAFPAIRTQAVSSAAGSVSCS
jgi:hypothetical protein